MGTLEYQHGGDASREQCKQIRLRWFGPSRAEVWKRLADEMSARYQESGWFKSDRVIVNVPPWEIVLDVQTLDDIVYTRMRAPYSNSDGFRFTIFRKHFFSGLAELFGSQDIPVGFPEIDDPFVIRGNDAIKVRRLLSNSTIRRLLLAQPKVRFEVRDDDGYFGKKFPVGVDHLRFLIPGVIKDIDRLKLLYDLFAETLQELCRMGSAYDCEPGVEL